jgi:hypothetical protein
MHRMTIQAFFLALAFVVPVFARDLSSNVEVRGCYGAADDIDHMDAIVIPAVEGIVVNKDSFFNKYFSDNYIQHNPGFPDGKETLYGLL